jgi:hypothetical protein
MVRAVARRVAVEGPAELLYIVELEQAVADAMRDSVAGLRESGFTDAAIGRVFGVTRQAVRQRFPR